LWSNGLLPLCPDCFVERTENGALEAASSGSLDEADKHALRLAPWDRQAAAMRDEIRSRNRSTSRGSE